MFSCLSDLKYIGTLYHYTDDNGYNGILNPAKEFNFPDDCISLMFNRIDIMTRNDSKERKHIRDYINELCSESSSSTGITKPFADIVLNYDSTAEALYTISGQTNGISKIKMDFGKCNCYVACFSASQNNQHIIDTFKSKYAFEFNSGFSRADDIRFYPFLSLNLDNAGLAYDVRRVVYSHKEISSLLLEELLYIQSHYFDKKDIEMQLQNIYALYDVFFKSEEYALEDEVRFVVYVPTEIDYKKLSQYKIVFRDSCYTDEKGNSVDVLNGKMFLPIDKTIFLNSVKMLNNGKY